MSTNVYIDGFNLYNGVVRNTPFKWLDISAMCKMLLPRHTINRIKYFTARVIGFPHDPDAPQRQDIYIRALRLLPTVDVSADAWFSSYPVNLPVYPVRYPDPTRPPVRQRVVKNEEKRTDVNIATAMLLDCFVNDCDIFVVISNDSDLIAAIETIRNHFGKEVGVINPHPPGGMSGHLKKVASWHMRTINKTVLQRCQLPNALTDSKGVFSKPPSW